VLVADDGEGRMEKLAGRRIDRFPLTGAAASGGYVSLGAPRIQPSARFWASGPINGRRTVLP